MTRIFNIDTLKGLKDAERCKAKFENKYERVIVRPIGFSSVEIHGTNRRTK